MDIRSVFSTRMDRLAVSMIGQLLVSTKGPGFISFTAGVPAPDSYALDQIKAAAQEVLDESTPQMLAYGEIIGCEAARALFAERASSVFRLPVRKEELCITTGSTQCIDLLGRLFLNEGDTVIVEDPTYVDAMQSMSMYGVKIKGIGGDEEGMLLEPLKEALDAGAKVLYVIPDFQNPTGRLWSVERRKAVMELVKKYDTVVFEDNPYGEIAFSGEIAPPLKTWDTENQVVFMASLSKIYSPGLRLGWMYGPQPVIDAMQGLKEKTDLHCSQLDQLMAAKVLGDPKFEAHLAKVIATYKQRAQWLVDALRAQWPELEFDEPKGGFFLWGKLPKGQKGMDLLTYAIEEKVAFVPGLPFYTQKQNDDYIRLAFPAYGKEEIDEGVRRLVVSYKKYCASL